MTQQATDHIRTALIFLSREDEKFCASGESPPSRTRDEIAAILGFSAAPVQRALRIRRHRPDVAAAIMAGDIGGERAYRDHFPPSSRKEVEIRPGDYKVLRASVRALKGLVSEQWEYMRLGELRDEVARIEALVERVKERKKGE